MAENGGAPAPGWVQGADGGWRPGPAAASRRPLNPTSLAMIVAGIAAVVVALALSFASVGKIEGLGEQVDCGSVLSPGEVPTPGLGAGAIASRILDQHECDGKVSGRRSTVLIVGIGGAAIAALGLWTIRFTAPGAPAATGPVPS
jgi:hypothetical protein